MGIAKIRGNRGEGWFHGRSFWGRLGNLALTGSKILFDTFAKSDYYSVSQGRITWQGVWEDSAVLGGGCGNTWQLTEYSERNITEYSSADYPWRLCADTTHCIFYGMTTFRVTIFLCEKCHRYR